jgi:V8-like Glu-specific endopeptidase
LRQVLHQNEAAVLCERYRSGWSAPVPEEGSSMTTATTKARTPKSDNGAERSTRGVTIHRAPGRHDDDGPDRLEAVYSRLADIDPDDLRDALLAITEGAPLHRSVHDVPNPGKALAAGEGGAVTLDELPAFERIVGVNNQLPVAFLEEGTVVAKAVARVQLKESHSGLPAGSGWGTGSLISPSLLLTNNHVIPTVAFARKVRAEFNYQFDAAGNAMTSDAFDLRPDAFFHTNAGLDYTVVRVASKRMFPTVIDGGFTGARERIVPDIDITDAVIRPFDPSIFQLFRTPGQRWGHLRLPASGPSYAVGQYLNVVGHPSGRRKEVALQDNSITGVFTNVIRYTTDTEPGSSGSPVFTNGWDIVALHHAGGDRAPSGAWLNNEGMRVDRIVADLRANAPAAIRTELGI